MIELTRLTYRYPADDQSAERPAALDNVSLSVAPGEFVLIVGPSGAGKSTLLRCLNGLAPHFYGGTVAGHIRVGDQDPIALGPRPMSRTVGFVFQDPETQAVVDVVEDELAFAMENQGFSRAKMRERIDWALSQLDIAHLRRRKLSTLSGGERQRVAISAVLTLQPRVLVLDEPTSQLDPHSAREVLDALVRLNRDLGLTVVLSEHRLERVVRYADRIVWLPGDGSLRAGPPREMLQTIPLVPPLIELGRTLGWSPLPLTLSEARERVQGNKEQGIKEQPQNMRTNAPSPQNEPSAPVLCLEKISFAYNDTPALCEISLTMRRGEFVALMGHNGAGKSTLLKLCIGLLKPSQGRISILGMDVQTTPVEQLARRVGLVPQNPNALLFADTVADELAFTRRAQGLDEKNDESLLRVLGLWSMRERYPRDLSSGERQRTALAAILVGDPDLILLDEPTRGLDYAQKEALIDFLLAQRARGKTVLLVTHDVETVARCAERIVVLQEGRIAADGPVGEIMSTFPVFASQMVRLYQNPTILTVQDALEI